MWTLTISPEQMGLILDPMIFSSILAFFDIMRRMMWNLFRLENEQLNNIGKFRAYKEVPIRMDREKLRSGQNFVVYYPPNSLHPSPTTTIVPTRSESKRQLDLSIFQSPESKKD
jgi:hypothetical protein